jgi:hypothetical protein
MHVAHIETVGQSACVAKPESHDSSGFHESQCTPSASMPVMRPAPRLADCRNDPIGDLMRWKSFDDRSK